MRLLPLIRKSALLAAAMAALWTAPQAQAGTSLPGAWRPRPSASRIHEDATVPGLGVVEALIEDLTFRNLQIYDREVLQARLRNAASASRARRGAVTVYARHGSGTPGLPPAATSPSTQASRSHGMAPAVGLAAYLNILARTAPGPLVTGRFSDWRNPSVYRLMAGLHHGYDIAYAAGTPIVAGWPGRVTSVVNWYGAEYGITVESSSGFRTTYGHLSPRVPSGATIGVGDVVGTVVNDHVDVKMRDAHGAFIDFGHGIPATGGVLASTQGGVVPGGPIVFRVPSSPARGSHPAGQSSSPKRTLASRRSPLRAPARIPPLRGPDWTRRSESVRAALAWLRLRHRELSLLASHADAPALLPVRRRLEDAQARLVAASVPEDVLMAAFLDSPDFRAGRFSSAEVGSAGADPADEAPRVQARIQSAQQAVEPLRALLRALDSPSR